ncbi:MAG TPA: hypothetical protein VFW11_06325 [Cyclobacteriaceae bacterium]|nr:hypothetical protein [Cyclobacteriaceae bacterium]
MVQTKKTATLTFGVLTAAIFIVSQLFCYQHSESPKTEAKTEKHSKELPDDQGGFVIVAASPGLSSIQTQINHEISFLFEIVFQGSKPQTLLPDVPLALGKYFQTLFNIIISPNAP